MIYTASWNATLVVGLQ